MIYFLQPVEGGPIKIGCSENIDARREQLEARYGQPLALLATMKGDVGEEFAIHRRFKHLRLGRTEQFRPAPELMEFINRPLLVDPNPSAVAAMELHHRKTIVCFKAHQGFEDWFKGLIGRQRLPASCLIEHALIFYAKSVGYDEPPPRR